MVAREALIAIACLILIPITVKILKSIVKRTIGRANPVAASRVQVVGGWIISFILITLALSQLGLDVTILYILIGLAGLTFIIASKDLLANLLAEQVLLTQAPFKVGDWIKVGDHFGRVVEINPVSTILVTPDNERVIIPNSVFSTSIVLNQTVEGGIRISVPIVVGRRHELTGIEEELLKIGKELSKDLAPHPPEVVIDDMTRDHVKLRLDVWALNPLKREHVTSEIRKRVKAYLDELPR